VKKKCNGEGTIYKKGNRWFAQTYVTLADGTRKRRGTSAADRTIVEDWLDSIKAQEKRNIPFAEKSWTVGAWIDHFLQNHNVRPNTLLVYESVARRYIKPYLGKIRLEKLSIGDVQNMIDKMGSAGCGARTVRKTRQVLSAALGKAMRQELLFRNVAMARLLDLPEYSPKEKQLWTIEETRKFLDTAKSHPWFFAYMLIFTYGMRCGEALGLRWSDIDFQNETFRIRQQIQVVNGKLTAVAVKTKDSQRDLFLTPHVKAWLYEIAQANDIDLSKIRPDFNFSTELLITKSSAGTPVCPHNFGRALDMLIKKAGLPRITPHVSRHMAATLNKDIGTPLKDTQGILGHADSAVTQKIYQHGTSENQKRALTTIDMLLHSQTVAEPPRCSHALQHALNQDIKISLCKGLLPALTSGIRLATHHTKGTVERVVVRCTIYETNSLTVQQCNDWGIASESSAGSMLEVLYSSRFTHL